MFPEKYSLSDIKKKIWLDLCTCFQKFVSAQAIVPIKVYLKKRTFYKSVWYYKVSTIEQYPLQTGLTECSFTNSENLILFFLITNYHARSIFQSAVLIYANNSNYRLSLNRIFSSQRFITNWQSFGINFRFPD